MRRQKLHKEILLIILFFLLLLSQGNESLIKNFAKAIKKLETLGTKNLIDIPKAISALKDYIKSNSGDKIQCSHCEEYEIFEEFKISNCGDFLWCSGCVASFNLEKQITSGKNIPCPSCSNHNLKFQIPKIHDKENRVKLIAEVIESLKILEANQPRKKAIDLLMKDLRALQPTHYLFKVQQHETRHEVRPVEQNQTSVNLGNIPQVKIKFKKEKEKRSKTERINLKKKKIEIKKKNIDDTRSSEVKRKMNWDVPKLMFNKWLQRIDFGARSFSAYFWLFFMDTSSQKLPGRDLICFFMAGMSLSEIWICESGRVRFSRAHVIIPKARLVFSGFSWLLLLIVAVSRVLNINCLGLVSAFLKFSIMGYFLLIFARRKLWGQIQWI